MLQIYYGDGKGKTTCAVGLAVRCAGTGGKVLFVQFLKDNKGNERKILEKIENITLYPCPNKIKFLFDMNENEKTEISKVCRDTFIDSIQFAVTQEYSMIIFDELNCVIGNKIIDIDLVKEYLNKYKNNIEVVLTGYDFPKQLEDLADYISYIQKLKHPFDNNIKARKGIEF